MIEIVEVLDGKKRRREACRHALRMKHAEERIVGKICCK
jgi:hypothetical protein